MDFFNDEWVDDDEIDSYERRSSSNFDDDENW